MHRRVRVVGAGGAVAAGEKGCPGIPVAFGWPRRRCGAETRQIEARPVRGLSIVQVPGGEHRHAGRDRPHPDPALGAIAERSEEHTSELQSLMRISYAVFCLKKKNQKKKDNKT